MNSAQSPSSPSINATVMASAGTGKTYMLVNRLVRLLLNGARPDAILAITFTRKAAAEMQSRLSGRLQELASADEAELIRQLQALEVSPEPQTIARARRLFEMLLQGRESVKTTTFHAFCQEILLRFPLEAGISPGFELLENGGEQLQSARDALVDEASQAPSGELAKALQLLLDYCGGLNGLERSLNSFIAHRGDWWAYTEGEESPTRFAQQRLQQQLGIDPAENPIERFFTAPRLEALAEFSALLAKHPTKTNAEFLEALASARNPEEKLENRFYACRTVFLTQKNTPRLRKASKTQAKKMGDEGEARFLALHEELSQYLLRTLDEIAAHQTWHACTAWYLAGNRLLDHYQQIKQEQRVLDFSDLEWNAYRLLSRSDNALWVQYKLDQRIDHLLVDEFQDTNPTQWHLLLPLLQEMAATQRETPRSVFLVGDAKQSIYRFRRAEPRLFHAASEWLGEHLGAQAFPLHISWRSAPAIMQCVNDVFGEQGPLCGSLRDYSHHETHHQELWGRVTLLPLIEESATQVDEPGEEWTLRNPLEQPREVASDERYRQEGKQIANEIKQLIETGTVIGDTASARRVGYDDIMILVRKRSHTGYYEQALREAGIPYLGAERGTLLESLEIGDMVALLEVLLTPYSNLSLATVLRSPIFDCDDEDLIQLAEYDSGNWFQRLQGLAIEMPREHPLSVAAHYLESWQALAGRIPIHDLLDRIFHEGNVLERYQAALPPHLANRATANLTRFLELALEIDSGRYPSLGRFLSRLGEMRENSEEAPDEAPASGTGERVRILTIHASKGLEAPVVFLADTAQTDSADKAYRTLISWPPEAARPESFILVGKQEQQPAFVRQQLEDEQREQERESANLLYVALTRARQLLYISGVRSARGGDAGWYETLSRALLKADEISPGERYELTTGTPPPVHIEPIAPVAPPIHIDRDLSHPVTAHHAIREIAPSRTEASGVEAEIDTDEDGRLRGLVIHRLLQLMSEQEEKQWPHIARQVAAEFSLDASSRNFSSWYKECQNLLNAPALEHIFACGRSVETLNEIPIIYSADGQTVHGIIDRLILRGEEVWVIDYKTHKGADHSNAAELANRYRQQMAYYASGARRLWPGKRICSFILFTAPALLHEIPFEAE